MPKSDIEGDFPSLIGKEYDLSDLQADVKAHVAAGSALYTDALTSYDGLAQEYAHGVIDHAEKYVSGRVHTNGLENFWSLLKRGIGGTYVSVEPFHLFRYLDEQAFRYNTRKDANDEVLSDGDRPINNPLRLGRAPFFVVCHELFEIAHIDALAPVPTNNREFAIPDQTPNRDNGTAQVSGGLLKAKESVDRRTLERGSHRGRTPDVNDMDRSVPASWRTPRRFVPTVPCSHLGSELSISNMPVTRIHAALLRIGKNR